MSPQADGDVRDPAGRRPMSIEEIRASYAECAQWVDRFDWLNRRLTGRYRRRLFGDANGRVLDVACGTGANFPYLPRTVAPVGVDISPEMLAKARDRLERLKMKGTLEQMDAQALEFDDDSFDTVISSLSTCTFPDPVMAIEEMERVCKPTGRILLLEHGRSDLRLVARFQDWRADTHYATAGCRWNQEPLELVLSVGLPVRDVSTHIFGLITLITARPSKDSSADGDHVHLAARTRH